MGNGNCHEYCMGQRKELCRSFKIRFSCVSACVRGCPAVDYRMADFPLGLSFDDVLLLPRLSAVLPGDADISSQLVPGFDMKNPPCCPRPWIPFPNRNGVAWRGKAAAVITATTPLTSRRPWFPAWKRFENAVIPNPVTVNKDMTLEEVHQIMMDQGYSGFPVVGCQPQAGRHHHRPRHARRGRLPECPGQGRNDSPFPA